MSPYNPAVINKVLSPTDAPDFKILLPGGESFPPQDFMRIQGTSHEESKKIIFSLVFPKKSLNRNPFLQISMPNGSWSNHDFFPSKNSTEYLLSFPIPSGGYFHFRYGLRTISDKENSIEWEPDNYHGLLVDPVPLKNYRMYTLIPGATGQISDWIHKLDSIAQMGFNVVHILPFTIKGPSESPYSAKDLFNIEPDYLKIENDFEDFQTFTKKAASLGISLCFDIVLNHISNHSIMAMEHGNWLVPDPERPDGFKRAGCWHKDSWISWEDLALINYDHPVPDEKKRIYDFMLSYVLFWVEKAVFCGASIRLDNLHSSNPDFISWLLSELKKRHPEVLVLSEFFGSTQAILQGIKDYGVNLITANTWEYPFVPRLITYLKEIHSEKNPVRYFLSPTSHDTKSVAALFGTVSSSIPRYFFCALMGTGQTGIVQGFEYGLAEKINFIGKMNKIAFEEPPIFAGIISEINNLLAKEPFLESKGISFIEQPDDSLLLAVRTDPLTNQKLFLGANFNTSESRIYNLEGYIEVKVELSWNSDSWTEISENRTAIHFAPCGVCAIRLINQKEDI